MPLDFSRSPIASAAGTMAQPGCDSEAACESSVSSACASMPLASAAGRTTTAGRILVDQAVVVEVVAVELRGMRAGHAAPLGTSSVRCMVLASR